MAVEVLYLLRTKLSLQPTASLTRQMTNGRIRIAIVL